MSNLDGLVVRNTFLDFPVDSDEKQAEEDGEDFHPRPRAVSDLTDTKLPWKIPLSNQPEGMYQITRRRLGSNATDGSPPVADPLLHTVEEEDGCDLMSKSRKGSRSSRTGAGPRRPRMDSAEFSPACAAGCSAPGVPVPGFFPPMAMVWPHGSMPMIPPGYLPWGYAVPPPWGGSMPAAAGKVGANGPLVGKGAGKQRRESAGGVERGGKARGRVAKAGGEGLWGTGGADRPKAAPSPPLQPAGEPTTVMLRNIPNRYTSGSLLALLDERGFQALYDFVYLPMDFQNGVNLGYAFVNLLRHLDALRFKEVFQGFQDWRFDSAKVSEVSWAHPHQGLDQHVERYRNSPVMHPSMPDEYKPMIFQNGARVTFPPPTRVIKAPKLRLGRDRPREPGREEGLREEADLVAACA